MEVRQRQPVPAFEVAGPLSTGVGTAGVLGQGAMV